jgi:LacI family transcriptional regulator
LKKNLILKIKSTKCLLRKEFPDGIFAVNETYAALAMKIAQKRGFQIPRDIAFIGFTDGVISRLTTPTMTTIAQHGHNMGNKAAELVIQRIYEQENDKTPNQTVVISTNIVEREST